MGATCVSNSRGVSTHQGERKKFVRRTGGTNNDITSKTFSADEVIGEISDANYGFILIPFGPHGEINMNMKHLQTFLGWQRAATHNHYQPSREIDQR